MNSSWSRIVIQVVRSTMCTALAQRLFPDIMRIPYLHKLKDLFSYNWHIDKKHGNGVFFPAFEEKSRVPKPFEIILEGLATQSHSARYKHTLHT